MRELALFAGAGGGILGGKLLGWRTVCAVEIDPYCRSVLLARQRDGMLEPFPVWDDVRTFDGRPWCGAVDVISGGFPCQDVSSAGKRKGVGRGERSGLWREFARIIGEVRPQFAFVENSPHLRTRGLAIVLSDLARLGYDARWGVLGDCHAGGSTIGARMWVVAALHGRWERAKPVDAEVEGPPKSGDVATAADNAGLRILQRRSSWEDGTAQAIVRQAFSGPTGRTDLARACDGLANRVDRVKATGNGQVASLAALAWTVLTSHRHDHPSPGREDDEPEDRG